MMSTIELLQRLWTATLALSAALVIVAALRAPWRRVFGAEHACRLWWLPLSAVIASQLPHAARQIVIVHVPTMLTAAAPMRTAPAAANVAVDWRVIVAVAWLAGIVIMLLLAVWKQLRFLRRLRNARRAALPVPKGISGILFALDASTGPALVGAWRPRLVLPEDFDQRYDAHERALILAHEAMHARRRDGLIGAVATALHALFWFHPLAWWALPRLRRDQELACDAAVLRERPRARRCYANAMLKAQFAGAALPAGSFWPGHPIRERILMLKSPIPDSTRRIAGRIAVSMLAVAISAAAYAAGQPPAQLAKANAHAPEYQLAMRIKRGDAMLGEPIVCMNAGGSASISQVENNDKDGWSFDLHLRMQMADRDQAQVSLDGSLRSGGTTTPLHSSMRGALGKTMALRVDGEHGALSTELEIVPTRGCSARPAPPPPPSPVAPPPPPSPVAPPPPPPPMAPPPSPPVAPPPPAPTVEPSPPHVAASQGVEAAAVPPVPARPAIPAPSVMPAQSAVLAASAVPVATPAPTVNPVSAAQPVPAPASSERR